MITALILAAGESRRMNAPKALLPIGKDTFASLIARKLRDCGIDFIYLVAGADHDRIRKELPKDLGIEVILNIRYHEGQISSVKEGLRNVPTGSMEALVWPVDQPLVKAETVRSIIEAYQRHKKHLTIPIYQDRRGHPVLYDIHAIHTLLSFKNTQTAKDLQKVYSDNLTLVEVNDAAILIDIDTPEDYQKYIKDAGL